MNRPKRKYPVRRRDIAVVKDAGVIDARGRFLTLHDIRCRIIQGLNPEKVGV